ncbi:MAG: GNAT family N-acetyltransferase [Chloroflexi bacterium]|nr:GNAT family N-acetyltransferase [Chloroflexota bacterium]
MTKTKLKLVPTSEFTFEELADAYNQTRVDYMVPMPMNAERLAEYVHVYDVDLEKSYVAINSEQTLGLCMLGLRPGISWITRLGILPIRRRMGSGEALMRRLLEVSEEIDVKQTFLEVIKGNVPAHSLFLKLNFEEFRELLILRRPPLPSVTIPVLEAQWVGKQEALELLLQRIPAQAWTNQTKSLANAENIYGLKVETKDGGRGWLVFQRTEFNLSRLMFHTENSDPIELMLEMLAHLHTKFPNLDSYTENIPVEDPHFPAFEAMGYFEVFRRIEMVRPT